jgi:hypothetical protein
MVWLLPHPPPLQSVSSTGDTHRKTEKERQHSDGRVMERESSHIIQRRGSLVLFKSLDTLWRHTTPAQATWRHSDTCMWHPPCPLSPSWDAGVKAAELPYLEYRDIGRQQGNCNFPPVIFLLQMYNEYLYLCTYICSRIIPTKVKPFLSHAYTFQLHPFTCSPVAKPSFSSSPQSVCSPPVFRIRKYFVRIRGSAFMN